MKKYSILLIAFFIFFSTDVLKAQFNRKHDSNSDSNSNTSSQQQTTTNNNSTSSNAEEDDDAPSKKGFDKNKLIIGGFVYPYYNSGLVIQGSAIVGYKFTKKLALGISSEYYYANVPVEIYYNNNPIGIGKTKTRALGMGLWAKYLIYNNLFGSAVLEKNNYKYSEYFQGSTVENNPIWYSSVLVGLIYRQKIGGRFYANMSAYYDLLQQNPMYKNTIVYRLGFTSGF
jgi:hypothetical protein